MADVSISLSEDIRFQSIAASGKEKDCLLVDLSSDMTVGDRTIMYSRDRIYFHGTIESFRDFANKMLAALPAEPEPECTCEQTDVDRFDARGCELHAVAKSRAVHSIIVSDRPDEDLF